MTAISAHGSAPAGERSQNALRQMQYELGTLQAERRAGPWPDSGSLAEFQAAVDRAVREARRVTALEYRWARRHRLWERPEWSDAIEEHAVRLKARRERAREIAEGREQLLRRLLAEAEGRA